MVGFVVVLILVPALSFKWAMVLLFHLVFAPAKDSTMAKSAHLFLNTLPQWFI
jgi:hypothetical protein